MQKPRIAIICGGKTAFQSISLLALEGYLAGVAIGGKNNEAIDVLKKAVQQSKMPFIHIADKKELSQLKNWLMSINADYVFSINFPYIITEDLLNLLPEKWFNFHMGSLPKYRGAMPIFEVIKAGEKETAIAVHNMTDNIDDGKIVFQEPITITPEETFGSLAVKMRERMELVAQNLVQMLEFGINLPLTAQNEDLAEYFPMPILEDTRVIWQNMTAVEIIRLCNACNPWNNGADVINPKMPFKIIKASICEEKHNEIQAGTVLEIKPFIKIACINNEILKLDIVSSEYGITNRVTEWNHFFEGMILD